MLFSLVTVCHRHGKLGGSCLPGIFSPPWTICAPLALGSKYQYLNKIIIKMLHVSTETYNNEQILKFFRKNFS